MTTVLIILLAYPVANAVLNLIGGAVMSYILRQEKDFVQALLHGGPSPKLAFYPHWLKIVGVVSRYAYWFAVGRLPLDIKQVVVLYTPGWLWFRRSD